MQLHSLQLTKFINFFFFQYEVYDVVQFDF